MPEPPDFLQEAPQLWPHLRLYLNAFWDLCGDRAGMGDGRLLWSSAWAWGQAHGMVSRQFHDLWFYLSALDTEFLKHREKK
jgi:hypothetical protein